MTLSNQQFARTRRLALELAGIELVERHRQVLESRSRRLGIDDELGLESLLAAVELGEPPAIQRLLQLLTTKFTGFFRHPRHFEVATQHAVTAVKHRGWARFWSAGAATGEEPWSLAMALLEAFPENAPPVSILASDVDLEALAIAQRGEYKEGAVQALTPERRGRFLIRNPGARPWSIAPAARGLVEFRRVNLADSEWKVEGPFDLILCRNVLMYFGASHRQFTMERLATLLAPDGLLILDPTEHPGRAGHLFGPGADGVYRRKGAAQ